MYSYNMLIRPCNCHTEAATAPVWKTRTPTTCDGMTPNAFAAHAH